MQDNQQAQNLWRSIWTKPRLTIQHIIDTNPGYMVLILAMLSGISQTLDKAVIKNLGDTMAWPKIVLISTVSGMIGGIVGLYVLSMLLHWSGSWLHGKASAEEIRAAIAWSTVPISFALLFWLPQLALYGQDLFSTSTPVMDATPAYLNLFLALSLIELLLLVWSLMLLLKCLSQVQGFSVWKVLGTFILAILMVVIPVVILALLLGKVTT